MAHPPHATHCHPRPTERREKLQRRRDRDRRHPLPSRRLPQRTQLRPHPHSRCPRALAPPLARPRLLVCYKGRGGELISAAAWNGRQLIMDERTFYTEKEEVRKTMLVCPSCHKDFEFPVRWKVCRKKKELPRGAGPEDRKKFDRATSYMVRLDDLVACYKCRKRFELTGQSTVLINDNLGDPTADPENFGNR